VSTEETSVARIVHLDVSAFMAYSQRGQAEPGCRNARHDGVVGAASPAAVFHKTALRVGLLQEELKICLFQFF